MTQLQRLTLADSVTVSSDVVFRTLDGEAVLLRLDTGTYYGLEPVGTRIWELIIEHGSLRGVLDAMLREFDVDAARLESDVVRLAAELCANGLATVSAR